MFIKYHIGEEVYFFERGDKFSIIKGLVEEIVINAGGVYLQIKTNIGLDQLSIPEMYVFPSDKKAKEFIKNKVLDQLDNL